MKKPTRRSLPAVDTLLTVREFAQRIHVSEAAVLTMLESGELAHVTRRDRFIPAIELGRFARG